MGAGRVVGGRGEASAAGRGVPLLCHPMLRCRRRAATCNKCEYSKYSKYGSQVQGAGRHARLYRSRYRLQRRRRATRTTPDGEICAGSTYNVSLVRADVASRHELAISVRDCDARCTQSAHGSGGWIVRADTCAFTASPDAAPPPCGLPYGIDRAAVCAVDICPPQCRLPPAARLAAGGPRRSRPFTATCRHSPPLAAALRTRTCAGLCAHHGSPTAAG